LAKDTYSGSGLDASWQRSALSSCSGLLTYCLSSKQSVVSSNIPLCRSVDQQMVSVDAFLRRSKRCGFCPHEVADYDQLLEDADDQLFKRILNNRHHTLYQLIPPQSTASQKYNLRRRTHDRQLHDHQGHLSDCNFITRLLCRNSY